MVLTGWATLAMWYRLPLAEFGRAAAASAFLLFGIGVSLAVLSHFRNRALTAFVAAFAVVLIWWNSIQPLTQAEWAPDVARQVTGVQVGNLLTLNNVRDFDWRSNSDFTENWVTRTYDLSSIKSVDLFMSYWSGPQIAHVIMSFGFLDGEYLAWSIEVRRKNGGQFSPLADLFKSNSLVIVAAEERDVVGVRSNIRGEDVQLYRLGAPPAAARALLLQYVDDANALAKKPEFYNSLTTNCTTTIVKMIRAVGDDIPLDWRLVVNGYLPDYAYAQGALDKRLRMSDLRALAHIDERARQSGLSDGFSRVIRIGVPSPLRTGQ